MQILNKRRWWKIISFKRIIIAHIQVKEVNSWMLIQIKKIIYLSKWMGRCFLKCSSVWYFSTQGGSWFWHFVNHNMTISMTPSLLLPFSPSPLLSFFLSLLLKILFVKIWNRGVLHYHYYLFKTCTHLKWHLENSNWWY
jgi:hypothetical protein